ncbi:MAG: hypothetical protein IPP71_10085 [Bacteroidetes bacterium]|nr:hypothetical protein [Bacteroidota bacterium]
MIDSWLIYFQELTAVLNERLAIYDFANEFLKISKTDPGGKSEFYRWAFSIVEVTENRKIWDSKREPQKIYDIFSFILSHEDNETRIRLLMKFLNVIVDCSIKKNKEIKIVLHYDNIDRLSIQTQSQILKYILTINDIASLKMIISLRRSSKAKFDYWVGLFLVSLEKAIE